MKTKKMEERTNEARGVAKAKIAKLTAEKSPLIEIMTKAGKLRGGSDPKDWKEIAAIMEAEGILNTNGEPYNSATLRKTYSAWGWYLADTESSTDDGIMEPETVPKEKGERLQNEDFYPGEPPEQVEEKSKPTYDSPPEATTTIGVDPIMEQQIREIARQAAIEAVKEATSTINMNDINVDTSSEDWPPEPERIGKGKKRNRDIAHLTTTIDRTLLELFKAEAKERRISAGLLIDAILWRHYGKPRLSYMTDESETDSPEA